MKRTFHAGSGWIATGCIVILTVLWLVTAQRMTFERNDDIRQAIEVNENLALALEEHTARTIKVVDQALQLLRFEILREGDEISPEFLKTISMFDPATYVFVSIVDAKGMLRLGTNVKAPIDLSDREYFIYHRDHPDGSLRISGPAASRVSGKATIMLSRRIERADGSFAGVVVAGLDPRYFSRLYDRVDSGQQGFVVLLGLDGHHFARRAGAEAAPPSNMSASALMKRAAAANHGSFASERDGVMRYISFRVMRDYGLVIAIGASRNQILAQGYERDRWYLAGAMLATIFVLIFGSALIAAMRQQKRAMDAAIARETLYRVTYDQTAVGIAHTDLDGRFRRANAKYCEMVGRPEAELLKMTFMDVLHPKDIPSPETMARVLREGGIEEEERFVRKDGSVRTGSVAVAVVRDAAGKPDYFVAMVQDITERKKAQEQAERTVHYDLLTGLPNRTLLFDRLAQNLKHARRKKAPVGLLFIDLDRFKNVNDTLGHRNGDLLLKTAAERVSAAVRTEDTVCRAGGDEFVVVLSDLASTQDAARVAKKLVDAMAAPFRLEEREVFVTASIGIAVFPVDGDKPEILVNNANAAMLRAKQLGRNNFQFYTAALNERSAEKLLLESDLRRALERREFVLHFQPKASLQKGELTGFEALIRWRKADGSLVPPGLFVPLLEESGLIVPVGEWVIRAACAQLREWQRAGLAPVPVAVNVAANQFLRTDLCALIDSAVREFGIDPHLLEIEITESDVMQEPDRVVPVLHCLSEKGVHTAIDDFGTGYSSLSYLARLPIQTLKIDRSFVQKMVTEANDLTLVSTMVSLAHSLRLSVIAEGVETEEQAKLLRLLRCDQMQGYLYGRPMPAADCAALLHMAPTRVEKVAA